MVKFEYKGIKIEVVSEMKQHNYEDEYKRKKSHLNSNIKSSVCFWDFNIDGLTELSFVKSTLNYFMTSFWRRSGKEGSRIDLAKAIHHEVTIEIRKSLYFASRQKGKKNSLQILLLDGRGIMTNEIYLDAQEVLMLDIAIGKTISLLSPEKVYL